MAYFKVGTTDLSSYVSALTIKKAHNYSAQTNAAGDTVVDYINTKRVIEVEIIPLLETNLQTVLNALSFSNTISYREPTTGALTSGITCICDEQDIQYYTIQVGKVMYQKLNLTFKEL